MMARNIHRTGGYTPGQRHTDLQAVVACLTGAAVLLRGRADLPDLAAKVWLVVEEAIAERDAQDQLVRIRAAEELERNRAVQE